MTGSQSRAHRLIVLTALTALVLAGPQRAVAQVSFKTLYTFTGSSDAIVLSALIQGIDGNFYGTTSTGGAADAGTVYRMTPTGSVTVLHEFAGGSADGATPLAALIQAKDGNFYGTTNAGGANDLGTIFRMTPSGTLTILHHFARGSGDGANPQAALIQATDGNFYGTTYAGGSLDLGSVFRMTPNGAMVLLHSFTGVATSCSAIPGRESPCPGEDADGRNPTAALLQAVDGNFYGTTNAGGGTNSPFPNNISLLNGTIFRMTPSGVVTTLKSFVAGLTGCCRGEASRSSLIQASDGNLYGTTSAVGSGFSDDGRVFKLNPSSGGFATVVRLQSNASLIQATDGNFYGEDYLTFFAGAVFRMTPGGDVTTLQATSPHEVGSSLLQAADGTLYGTLGGNRSFSVAPSVYQLSAGLPAPAAPAIAAQPLSQTVRAGQRAVFVAAANGLPTPVFQWQVSSDNGGTWTNVTDGGPYSGAGTSQLSVTPPTRAFDSYQFRAVATNMVGTATSNPASLTVRPKGVTDFDGDGKTDLAILRPSSGNWFIRNSTTGFATSTVQQFGQNGDIPVSGDYDGDGQGDFAVWRPSSGVWFILTSSSAYTTQILHAWGLISDLPVPGDYDGDGKTDLAVYRPSTGIWYIARSSTNYATVTTLALGLSTDIPVPADYDGDGTTDIAIYRPSTGRWTIRNSGSATSFTMPWGIAGDVPVPGDYDGDGKADLALWRPSNGVWYLKLSSTNFTTAVSYQWGQSGDVPVPADYDGDGRTDPAVFRPASGTWWILNATTGSSSVTQWGTVGDLPAPNAPVAYALAATAGRPTVSTLANFLRFGDLDGDGKVDLTVWRSSSGTWFTARSGANYTASTTLQWGLPTDIPVTGDYDGDGKTDVAVFRPSNGFWYIVQSSTNFTSSVSIQWGTGGDIAVRDDVPVPGDYDGDGKTDVAVYRPSTGVWYILQSSSNFTTSVAYQWGRPATRLVGVRDDVTVPGDYDGDGLTDIAVYRPFTGVWYILQSASNYTTSVAYEFGGQGGDIAAPGDFDGDGRTDLAVYRPSTGTWFIEQSSTNYATSVSLQFGLSFDIEIPVPGDFDGDGRTDIAMWRPSTGVWSVLQSRTNFTTSSSVQWGTLGDAPVTAATLAIRP